MTNVRENIAWSAQQWINAIIVENTAAVFVTLTHGVLSVTGTFAATATQRTKDAAIVVTAIVKIVKMMNSFSAITADHTPANIVVCLTGVKVKIASKFVARNADRETQ